MRGGARSAGEATRRPAGRARLAATTLPPLPARRARRGPEAGIQRRHGGRQPEVGDGPLRIVEAVVERAGGERDLFHRRQPVAHRIDAPPGPP